MGALRTLSLAFLFGCAAPPPNAPADMTVQAIRGEAIESLRVIEKIERPEPTRLEGDEHVARSLSRALAESREIALIALAWAGDDHALKEVARRLEPFFADPAQSGQRNAPISRGFHFYTEDPAHRPGDPSFQLLLGALDRRRPELAQQLREVVLKTKRTLYVARPPSITHDRSEREKYREWMRLKPEEAEPRLLAYLKNREEDVNRQCAAAYGLAAAGQADGIEWLRKACVGNLGLGGEPAVDLIESGSKGEQAYLALLIDQDGNDLPYPFRYSIQECREDLFWRHIDRFIFLKNSDARYATHSRIRSLPIPDRPFDLLVGKTDERYPESGELVTAILWSLGYHGGQTPSMRTAASIWMDGLLRVDGARFWPQIAETYLKAHLGTPEVMARAARDQLHRRGDRTLACNVLAEAGTVSDVPALRETARNMPEDPAYRQRARAWFAICRLTSSLGD